MTDTIIAPNASPAAGVPSAANGYYAAPTPPPVPEEGAEETTGTEAAGTQQQEATTQADPEVQALERAKQMEQNIRAREAQLREGFGELQATRQELAELRAFRKELEELSKSNHPSRAIKRLGIDIEQALEDHILLEKTPVDPAVREANERIEKMERELAEKNAREQKALYDSMVKQEADVRWEFMQQVAKVMVDDNLELCNENNEIIKFNTAGGLVFRAPEAVADAWAITEEFLIANPGKVPDPKAVARAVENYYEQEAEKALRAPKIRSKLLANQAPAAKPAAPAKKPTAAMKTLGTKGGSKGNAVIPSKPGNKPLTLDEYEERFQQILAQDKARRAG